MNKTDIEFMSDRQLVNTYLKTKEKIAMNELEGESKELIELRSKWLEELKEEIVKREI